MASIYAYCIEFCNFSYALSFSVIWDSSYLIYISYTWAWFKLACYSFLRSISPLNLIAYSVMFLSLRHSCMYTFNSISNSLILVDLISFLRSTISLSLVYNVSLRSCTCLLRLTISNTSLFKLFLAWVPCVVMNAD